MTTPLYTEETTVTTTQSDTDEQVLIGLLGPSRRPTQTVQDPDETLADLAQAQQELAAERETVRRLRERNSEVLHAHERFREQVRDVAIRVADENNWCDNGLNEVLAELNLAPKEREFEVTVTVTAQQERTITITAIDEDDAQEKARNNDNDVVSDAIDNFEWVWDNGEITVDYVEAE